VKNAKPPRSDDEVRKQAATWTGKWTPADGIEPWLRRHMDEMKRMIRVDRWSWSDLARSLNEAGITYAGGQWTAALLGDKVAGLRWRQRKRERAAAPQHAFPVEFLREALGNLGSIQQLVINVQSTPSGPMMVALAGQPAAVPTLPAPPVAAPMPASVASPAPAIEQSAPHTPSGNEAEPPRRTFGYATPRGLDPVAKAPAPPPASPANAETPTRAAPTVNADDVLARFAPGATRR
jgi:hypothetical protein